MPEKTIDYRQLALRLIRSASIRCRFAIPSATCQWMVDKIVQVLEVFERRLERELAEKDLLIGFLEEQLDLEKRTARVFEEELDIRTDWLSSSSYVAMAQALRALADQAKIGHARNTMTYMHTPGSHDCKLCNRIREAEKLLPGKPGDA